jgi:hypothetical protein
MAHNAGYLNYFYDYGKCSAELKYELIGTDITKAECLDMGKQIGSPGHYIGQPPNVVYIPETKKCYSFEDWRDRY